VNEFNGCPNTLVIDMGTENALAAWIHEWIGGMLF
jgi:hypothetical protein